MLDSAVDVKRAVEKALDEADLFPRVVAGYSTRDGVAVIVVNVLFSEFDVDDAVFVGRVRDVVVGLGAAVEVEGVGLGRLAALFPTQGVDNPGQVG
jgi:hypothetical protein